METLSEKVINFCETLKNFKGGIRAQLIVDAIINSDNFKQMRNAAFDEKIYGHKNNMQLLTNINQKGV